MPIGPTFGTEIIAAGLGGLPFTWLPDGTIAGRENLTGQQNTALDAVIAAHDAEALLPIQMPTALIVARIEAEGATAWQTYVDYMFAVPARRKEFAKTMFVGRLQLNGNGFITTLQGAGFTAPQIARITARP